MVDFQPILQAAEARAPKGKGDRRRVQAAFNGWSAETGHPLCHLSMILALSAG